MSHPISVSKTALETFETIRNQIRERLGKKAVEDFERNTIKILTLIQQSPYMYKETELNPNIRKGLIKKVSSVFYEIKSDRIEVLFFWDNRQEPML
ncbi:hypothetical protein Phep_1092 [Pedobacter heparinus DSM 2366]|uniref:Plasmid stabilization system n=1 Tax=Pedobacter heparinus (strain ATCC 13125 / DSM 2366 / CIP 104194 / JCM 7457 / NBRC 12017 / NCIMB 9290 / NRRL B-14731 / HIM 762-3) TaxID=485917 RepID=C6Y3N1_PEDHD|nr:hypothetical protein Phep_1092 [Pedobacter heparinus DSM 2366]